MQRLFSSIALVLALGLGACGDDPPNVGAMCTSMSGCDEGLTCNTTVTGGYCTKACNTSGATNECPEESVCDSVTGGGTSCVKICKTSADCRSDQDCNGVSGTNIKACKPKA